MAQGPMEKWYMVQALYLPRNVSCIGRKYWSQLGQSWNLSKFFFYNQPLVRRK